MRIKFSNVYYETKTGELQYFCNVPKSYRGVVNCTKRIGDFDCYIHTFNNAKGVSMFRIICAVKYGITDNMVQRYREQVKSFINQNKATTPHSGK